MPIKIADGLDAVSELKKEGIVTIGEKRARTQDIRPPSYTDSEPHAH